jgi:hypothetical protein
LFRPGLTNNSPGLKPTSFLTLDAALKRRSSTVVRSSSETSQL